MRTRRILVRVGCHGVALSGFFLAMAVASLIDQQGPAGLFALLFVGWLITLRANPLPRVVERLIREAECPTCSRPIDLVSNVWACGCGFVDWRPRHALSRCPGPGCGKAFSCLVCPNCEATIPI